MNQWLELNVILADDEMLETVAIDPVCPHCQHEFKGRVLEQPRGCPRNFICGACGYVMQFLTLPHADA